VNSKDPKQIEPYKIGDDGADWDGDAGEGVADTIEIADEVP
jgi:hypothetical protein